MWETDLVTLLGILLFGTALAYKISFLHNRSIGYFSLMQVLMLVVVPGFVYVFLFSYIEQILERPVQLQVAFPDGLLVNVILLSALFAYGGVAVHAVTKMLKSALINGKQVEALVINKYFHLSFSHNMIFGGGVMAMFGLALLELNHIPDYSPVSLGLIVIKGVLLVGSLIGAMYFYTQDSDKFEDYKGKWGDLKLVFVVAWIGAVLLFYAIRKINPVFKEYNLLLPILVGFVILAGLNTALVVKRLKRRRERR